MKFVRSSIVMLMLLTATLWGAGPGEEYVRIYSLIQQGETLEQANKQSEALAAFIEAGKGLSRLQKASPDWNPKVVNFRLRYVQSKIDRLSPQASVRPVPKAVPATSSTGDGPATPPSDSVQITEMKAELQQLRSENSTLQNKLKEALSIQPPPVDPKEFEELQQMNAELAGEIETLRASLQAAQQAVSDNQAAGEEKARADDLETQVARLTTQLAALKSADETAAMLREENEILKVQLTELQSRPQPAAETNTQEQLETVVAELALARSEADVLHLEKEALENRLQGLRVEWERVATADSGVARSNNHEWELERLKARLAVYEAKRAPYSIEELTLIRMGKGAAISKAMRPVPPPEAGPLVAEAERAFKQGEFQQAERALERALETDATNAFTLSNLAATQMEQGRDDDAEVNLRKALASAPMDPFTLATMGVLQFRQKRYEDALDYLGLAAQHDPDNAVVQNYLGMALSEQGMRGPAETALRRAIQLQPNFSDAHYNLALVYILQDPPLPELARWHYQKALELGHDRSPELQQLLDNRRADQAF